MGPSGVAVNDDGVIFISDYVEHCIYRIEDRVSSVFAGTCGQEGFQDGGDALFNLPRGMDFDLDGNLIVADAHNFLIRSISPDGIVSTIAGSGEELRPPSEGPALSSNLYPPFGIAVTQLRHLFL